MSVLHVANGPWTLIDFCCNEVFQTHCILSLPRFGISHFFINVCSQTYKSSVFKLFLDFGSKLEKFHPTWLIRECIYILFFYVASCLLWPFEVYSAVRCGLNVIIRKTIQVYQYYSLKGHFFISELRFQFLSRLHFLMTISAFSSLFIGSLFLHVPAPHF